MAGIFDPEILVGERIILTGGGGGLGRGLARRLAEHGAQVHLWGRRGGLLREVAAEINRDVGGDRASFQAVDVREPQSVDEAVQEIWDSHGPVTGLVNGAAANFIAETAKLSPRAFESVTATVMSGSYNATHSCGRRWIEQEVRGSVVSLLTTWIWTGSAFVTPAAMAKSAVHAMTMSLAVEWARYGIRLNGIAAGPIPTEYAWEMLNPTDKSGVGATQSDSIPVQRFGTVEELANLTIFLLSSGCDYLTGHTIAMDGAQHLAGPGTFAGLTRMSDQDWAEVRERGRLASAASRSHRTTGGVDGPVPREPSQ
jgi:NAD(P)-dependent dehydrogenase (short-subunit alcohol dehydrogenase family)